MRVFVIQPSLAAFLLSLSTGRGASVDSGVEVLYSVVLNSVKGTDGGTGVEMMYSVIFNSVEGEGAEDGGDDRSGR